jgi:hypothetical protein
MAFDFRVAELWRRRLGENAFDVPWRKEGRKGGRKGRKGGEGRKDIKE